MDDQEPTAWEDINPVVRRESPPPVAALSALEVRQADIYDLEPVDRGEFYAEIAPCLTLAAGVGMSQADQRAWLEAAFIALEGIPIGLLQRGAQVALRTADHPSKIVPAIMEEIGDSWKWRRGCAGSSVPMILGTARPRTAGQLMDARGKPMTDAETDTLNKHLEWLESPMRYRADGSKYRSDRA